jgi:uncharacterized cupredoxin-like copper-binding protein
MVSRTLLSIALLLSLDAAAQRTIAITMSDTMRYEPAEITVKRGEPVRFVATNTGKLVHEMVIGTKQELEDHARHMREHPQMHNHGRNALSVAPGKTGELRWRAPNSGVLYFGCLEPGHFEAGMVGKITVE